MNTEQKIEAEIKEYLFDKLIIPLKFGCEEKCYCHAECLKAEKIIDELIKYIAGRSKGLEREKENAIGFAHWKDRHFERTYPSTGYFYCLTNYESVKLIPGVKYGEHYSFEQLYEMYIISQK